MFALDEAKLASDLYSAIYTGKNFHNLPRTRQLDYIKAIRQIKENIKNESTAT